MILLSKSKDLLFCIDIIFRCKELFVYVHVSGGYLYVYVYIYFKNKKKCVYIYMIYEVIFGITEANCGSVLRKNIFKSFNFEDPVLRHADLLMCKL